MKFIPGTLLVFAILISNFYSASTAAPAKHPVKPVPAGAEKGSTSPILGFRNPAGENAVESRFLAVPEPKISQGHMRILTQAPHIAGSTEDKDTPYYVAGKIREGGSGTEIGG